MTSHPLRWAPLVVLGLVCGLVQVAVGVVLYLSGVYFEPWSLRLMILLLAVSIAAGNWWYGKHVLGGQTTYWKALLVGVVISVSMALVYVTYNAISISFVYSHFLEDMVLAEFDRASTEMNTTQAARLLDSLRAEATLRNLVIGNFTSASRIGAFWSILIALAFVQRGRRERSAGRQEELLRG
jgi:hypothetical protein